MQRVRLHFIILLKRINYYRIYARVLVCRNVCELLSTYMSLVEQRAARSWPDLSIEVIRATQPVARIRAIEGRSTAAGRGGGIGRIEAKRNQKSGGNAAPRSLRRARGAHFSQSTSREVARRFSRAGVSCAPTFTKRQRHATLAPPPPPPRRTARTART